MPAALSVPSILSATKSGDPTIVTTDPLNTTKTVVPNGDGTYKITLSVTGAVEESSHTEVSSANVIIVLDKSTSMEETMGSGTRLKAVTDAAELLIDAMPIAANVEMALISFGGSVSTDRSWTTINSDSVKTSLKNALPTSYNSGTNWTDALTTAKTLADNKKSSGDSDPTYIIFLTDGCPTTNKSGHKHGSGGTRDINDTCISDPLSTMTAMVNAGYNVYGIYANTTSDSTRPYSGSSYTGDSDPLRYVIRVSGAAGYYNADSTSALEDVFTALAKTITDSLGYSDVEIDDGVTSMSNISASASISGEATGFVYTKDGVDWTDAPDAEVVDGAVVWDLSEVGNLAKDVVYAVSFDVWPSQAAYDLVADLNNGIRKYDELTQAEKNQITGDEENGYSLLTNTYLTTSYTHNKTSYQVNGDKGDGAMKLEDTTISLEKLWPDNNMDDYSAGASSAGYKDSIKLEITKDGEDYLEVELSKDNDWKLTGEDAVYISCGLIAKGEVKESGHDYTVTEPAAFSYYWDLIAEVYHPMVIDGVTTLLILNDEASGTDGTDFYTINEHKYVKASGSDNTLSASNYRRSNLNLKKEVDTASGDNDYFTYTVTITDPTGEDIWFSADSDPTEAFVIVKDEDLCTGDGVTRVKDENDKYSGYYTVKSGSTFTIKIKKDWNVRFLNLLHDSTYSIEEIVPSDYELTKLEAGLNQVKDKQGTLIDDSFVDPNKSDWYTINDKKIEGSITEPNHSYQITYTNSKNVFYVYHSSDGSVETYPLKENEVFNIYEKTKESVTVDGITTNYMYGGYYADYSGKGKYANDGVSVDDFIPYTGDPNVWKAADAYLTKGTEMKPKAGTTYYLKEVPDGYLRPYTHYVYDRNSTPANKVVKLFAVSAVDDANYNNVKMQIATDETVKLYKTMTVKSEASSSTIVLTAKKVFNTNYNVKKGYLAICDLTGKIDNTTVFTMTPTYVTFDGITVEGKTVRKIYMGDGLFESITDVTSETSTHLHVIDSANTAFWN